MASQHGSVWVLSILWVLLSNCASTTSESATEGANNIENTSTGSNVTALNFSGSATTLTISDLSADSDAVLVLYGTQDETQSSQFSLSSAVQQSVSSQAFQATSHKNENSPDFHQQLLEYAHTFSESDSAHSVGFQAALSNEVAVGSIQSFEVMNSMSDFEQTETVSATLIYQTEFFNFYVDNDSLETMSYDNISELCENFADAIDSMHANFGEESDVNGDGRFDILATPVVNRLSEDTQSITTGFFFAKDLYNVSGSNHKEVIYVAVPDPESQNGFYLSEEFAFSNILPAALPHEFQHMINHNMRVFENNADIEADWLNEALSHLAEDIYERDENGYMLTRGIENPSRIKYYFNNIESTCFVCDVDLAARGGSYLFLRAMYDAAEQGEFSEVSNGQQLLQRLVNSNESGVDNVVKAVYGADADASDFDSLLGQFALELYFGQNDISQLGFPTIEGIDLLGYQYDNRQTILPRLSMLSLTEAASNRTLVGKSMIYIHITGDEVVALDGHLVINTQGSGLSGYLIQTSNN